MPTIAVGLLRHFGPGSVLRERHVWRGTILPLGMGSILGIILIWSAWGVFRHLPNDRAQEGR